MSEYTIQSEKYFFYMQTKKTPCQRVKVGVMFTPYLGFFQFEEIASGESYSIKDLEELEKLQMELNSMKDTLRDMLTELDDALKLSGEQALTGKFDVIVAYRIGFPCRAGTLSMQ